ncbi:Bax inhibitor-1 family protein [Ligilactobacillus sp. LYQ135]
MRRQNTRKYIELTYLLFIVGIAIIFMSIYFTEKIFSNNYILSEGFFRNIAIAVLSLCIVDITVKRRLRSGEGGYPQFLIIVVYSIILYILWGMGFAIVDVALTAMHIGYIFSYSFITASAIFIATVIVSFSKKAKYSNKTYFILSLFLLDMIIIDIINYFLGWNWVHIIIDIVGIILFTLFVYFDSIKLRLTIKEYLNNSRNKIQLYTVIILSADKLLLDFINIWVSIADLMMRSEIDND